MIRQVLAGLLCLTPLSSTFLFSVEAAVANPQEHILPNSLTKVAEPATKQLQPYGGKVISPTAKVQGYSLDDMAQALAYFTKTGNNLAYLPKTPFQILYIQDFSNNTGSFTVPPGQLLFVPLVSLDTLPPVIGNFPAYKEQAADYIFGSQDIGAKLEIDVDGVTTIIDDPSYVAGPKFILGLPVISTGEDFNFIQVGVFLTPLSPGEHTIIGRLYLNGDAILNLFGEPFVSQFTYKVTVK